MAAVAGAIGCIAVIPDGSGREVLLRKTGDKDAALAVRKPDNRQRAGQSGVTYFHGLGDDDGDTESTAGTRLSKVGTRGPRGHTT